MKTFTAVIERCPDTKLYVGHIPGFPGAHSQGKTFEELENNLREVLEMLLEEGQPEMVSEFVGTQNIVIAEQ
ncbi:MAG: type II toxin-antitoxin system HicB family antitoxin [Thermodesulfobacteriota bacterium]|nr:type II toxin-antitoxin system HicB family antitoxin [Thermodesulfobacteriota bacterium]